MRPLGQWEDSHRQKTKSSVFVHEQSMVFILFVHPVFLVCEKFAKVHTRSLGLRILVRIPVVLFLWFVALAIPFFGPINSVMGAFLVTFAVYIIPLVAFFVTYRTKAARQVCPLSIPPFIQFEFKTTILPCVKLE